MDSQTRYHRHQCHLSTFIALRNQNGTGSRHHLVLQLPAATSALYLLALATNPVMFSGAEQFNGSDPDQNIWPNSKTVWVLPIPSFDWIQLEPGFLFPNFELGGQTSPKCEIIGDRYVFHYGGRRTETFWNTQTCSINANAAFLLDLNTLNWTDTYTSKSKSYKVIPQVFAKIGGK